MKKFTIFLVVTMFLFIGFVSAEVYDDFSGSTLNSTLWTESSDSTSGGDLDEYGLDTTNQNYHTTQTSAGDRGRLLLLTQEFEEGDVLQYDVFLQESSGNIISRLYMNENYLDLIVGTDSGGYATSGDIGYWNGESEVGHEVGTYDVTIIFNDVIDIEIVNPSGTNWTYTISNVTPPYTFGVGTRTGHDGTGHIDYDNFEVTYASATIEATEEVNTTELQERVETLEWTIADLQTQVDYLKSISDDHEIRITSLEKAINWIVKRVNILWRVARP